MALERPILAIWLIGLGLALPGPDAALAQTRAQTAATLPAATLGGATNSLLDNANYWRSHNEPRAALRELTRVLDYAPNNPDVLAAAAEVAIDVNDYDLSAKYRARLGKVAPNDPRIAILAAEHQPTPQEIATLEDARKLARDGRAGEAMARYNEFLHGQPVPARLAIEYYTTLASSSLDGFDQANEQLGALAKAAPADSQLQVAYARLLILQENTRGAGIERLEGLAARRDVERAARQGWRDALLWQGASEKTLDQIDTYLKTNPTDPAIDAKRREAIASLPDKSGMAMIRGFDAWMQNDGAKAAQEFNAALTANPKNVDAMMMLAAVRRAQLRVAEAQVLIDGAIALAPERKAEILGAVGGEYTSPIPVTIHEQTEIARLSAIGDYAGAEGLLVRLYSGRESASSYAQLGDIQIREGHYDDAESSYRSAQTLNPRSADVICGLANALVYKGRYDDAAALYTDAGALYAKSGSKLGLRRVAMGRALLVRTQAASLDAGASATLYQTSLAADPRNIYLRAAYARTLQQAGRFAEASDLMGKGVDLARSDREGLQEATEISEKLASQQRVQEQIREARRSSLQQFYDQSVQAGSRTSQ